MCYCAKISELRDPSSLSVLRRPAKLDNLDNVYEGWLPWKNSLRGRQLHKTLKIKSRPRWRLQGSRDAEKVRHLPYRFVVSEWGWLRRGRCTCQGEGQRDKLPKSVSYFIISTPDLTGFNLYPVRFQSCVEPVFPGYPPARLVIKHVSFVVLQVLPVEFVLSLRVDLGLSNMLSRLWLWNCWSWVKCGFGWWDGLSLWGPGVSCHCLTRCPCTNVCFEHLLSSWKGLESLWEKEITSCGYLMVIVDPPCFLLLYMLPCERSLPNISTALDWSSPSGLLCLHGLEPSESVSHNMVLTIITVRYYRHRVTECHVLFYRRAFSLQINSKMQRGL